jgi:hypothetical protein
MTVFNFLKNIDDYMKNPKKLKVWFRQNLVAFLLAILVFVLLYVYIAESGRRKAIEGQLTNQRQTVKRLEDEVRQTKTDFFDLQKQIKQNDSIFYNTDINTHLDVSDIISRMSDRFEADGISSLPDDRSR